LHKARLGAMNREKGLSCSRTRDEALEGGGKKVFHKKKARTKKGPTKPIAGLLTEKKRRFYGRKGKLMPQTGRRGRRTRKSL